MKINLRIKKFFLLLLRDLEKYFESSSVIAEMGAGSAIFSLFFSTIYPDKKFILVDKNLDLFKKRKRYKYKFELKEEDALSTTISENTVDMVVSFGFLHHLSFPDIENFLKEVDRINKKWILIVDRNKDIIDPRIENYLILHEFEGEIDKENGKIPEKFYSLEEIKNLLNKNKYLCTFDKTYPETSYKLTKREIEKYLSHIHSEINNISSKKIFYLKKFERIKKQILGREILIPPYYCLLGEKIHI